MKKIKKPRKFKMPHSKVLVAEVGTEGWPVSKNGTYFQVYSSGSTESKTARRLAKWLIDVAKWMESK